MKKTTDRLPALRRDTAEGYREFRALLLRELAHSRPIDLARKYGLSRALVSYHLKLAHREAAAKQS